MLSSRAEFCGPRNISGKKTRACAHLHAPDKAAHDLVKVRKTLDSSSEVTSGDQELDNFFTSLSLELIFSVVGS